MKKKMGTGNIFKKMAAGIMAVCMIISAAMPQKVYALDIYKDTDGSQYANDEKGFVYYIPVGATQKKGCTIYLYGGKNPDIIFPSKCNSYQATNIGTNFSQIIMTKLTSVKIPKGYTTIEDRAFQNQTKLYRIEIPSTVKKIGKDVFSGCDKTRLTIVAPYGSAAEKYAKANGIQYSENGKFAVKTGGRQMYAGELRTIYVLNNSQNVTWKSSSPSVASVDNNGTVTAKKAGTVKITVTVGKKKYSYSYQVLSRTENNVLSVIWKEYVRTEMSDYEKALAADQWMQSNVSVNGTSVSAKKAFETGKVNYTGYANACQKILSHYGIAVKVVKGKKHMENVITIDGKKYNVSTLSGETGVNKTYTTIVSGIAINRNTMTLTVGGKGTFKVYGSKTAVKWTSKNTRLATVSKKGKVTAKKAGNVVITMKTGNVTYDCKVRIHTL